MPFYFSNLILQFAFCKTINSQKARLKLLIGQHANLTPQAFKQFMES